MLTRTLAVSTAALFLAGAAFAFPGPTPGKKKPTSSKPAAKTALTVVKVCPVTHEGVKGEGGGYEVVGKYKAYFCCAACKPEFAKLTAKEKAAKVADALKVQKAGKAKPMGGPSCPAGRHK